MRIPHGLRSALASQAAASTTDEYFSNVSLLLYGDGTNGSTDFVDSTGNYGTNYANSGHLAVNGVAPNGGTPYWVDIVPSNANLNYWTISNLNYGFYEVHDSSLTEFLYWTGSSYSTGNVTQARFDLRDFPTVSSVRIYARHSSGNTTTYPAYVARLLDSNKNVINNTSVSITSSTAQWLTIPVTGSPAFVEIYAPTPANARVYFHAIEVNGQQLISKPSITANGDAQISTAQSKFGGASMYFDGAGDYLTVPASDDFSFPGDFTVEFWIKTSTYSQDTSYRRVIATGPDTANALQLLFYNGSGASAYLSARSNTQLVTGTIDVADGNWHHVALTRAGSSIRLFVDGVQSGSTGTSTTNFSRGATDGLIIGRYQAGNGHFDGYLDDLRITKGVARYTANFTPPTSAFPDL